LEEVAPKESLEQIIETIPDGIIIIDRDGRITYTNAAAEGIFGLKRSEIIGKTYDDPTLMALTMEGRPIPAGKHPLAKAVQTGEPVYGFEHLHERPDGTRVIVSANAVPLRDKRGSIIGAVISLDDITEQKRAEEALRESERRFREMLEEADIVAVMLDTRGKVTFVNDFLLGLTGWQRNEVIGKDWFDTFVPPEQREQARQFFLESIARGEIEAH
jgi:PAS domain S-box-containing protein